MDDFEPVVGPGYRHEASSRTEQPFKDMLFAARLSPSAQATIRSQEGPRAGMALMTCPTCRITTIPPQLFRVTLLRRLRTSPECGRFRASSRTPGYRHEASSRTEQPFKDMLFAARLSPSAQATIRSQEGPRAGMALMTCPTCRITTIPPQLFRVTLLRRLRLPLPLTVRSCRCGLPFDEFGHHRAACAQAGVLSRRGWALESVVVRICREAGGRVTRNVLMRDLDLAQPDVVDGRRLEVIVDGLPLHSGARLAVDTALVCGTCCATGRRQLAVGRDALTLSCSADEPVRSWWSSPLQSEAGCLRKRGCSCLCWQEPRFARRIR